MAAVPPTVACACEDPRGPVHHVGGVPASHCQLCAARAPAHLPLLPEYVPTLDFPCLGKLREASGATPAGPAFCSLTYPNLKDGADPACGYEDSARQSADFLPRKDHTYGQRFLPATSP